MLVIINIFEHSGNVGYAAPIENDSGGTSDLM